MKCSLGMEPMRTIIAEKSRAGDTLPTEDERRNKHVPNTLLTPVLQDTIDMRHFSDNMEPDITDVTVRCFNGINTIVVTDVNNDKLKSVYCRNQKREMSILKLFDFPLRVVSMPGNKVAVLVGDRHIVLVEVRPELTLVSKIRTSISYCSITVLHNTTFALGCSAYPLIDIVDLNGAVLRTLPIRFTGPDLLKWPRYLSTTHEGNILVTDCASNSVYCLTSTGDVVFTYTPTGDRELKDPAGVTETSTGDVLLADEKTKKIIQLTSDGRFVRDVLTSVDGIDMPFGVCFYYNLYVCENSPNRETIKVYKLQ